MIDPVKILRRAWHVLWNYRTLWLFGLVIALALGSTSGNPRGSSSSNTSSQNNQPSYHGPSYSSPQEFFDAVGQQIQKVFREGIPAWNITGQSVTSFLWVIGVFLVLMLLISLIVTIAYYVSVTSVIRMVDEYENTGTKLTFRQGWRLGWSRSAWRVFLINLLLHLPLLLVFTTLLTVGVIIALRVINGAMALNIGSMVIMIGLAFLAIFLMLLLTFALLLLRPFFWRVCVLEDASVGESLRRGLAMVRENWKSAGVMWLVMIGLGLAWWIVSIIITILAIPALILTAILAATVVAIPALLLFGLFSLLLSGPVLPWIAAGLFVLPLFFTIAFSPLLLVGSWQMVFTSSVWTLTYREIKALPAALIPSTDLEPVGD